MEKNIRFWENKLFIIVLAMVLVAFATLFVFLTREPKPKPEKVEEKSPEEILIEKQTEELRIQMEDFKPLTEKEIEAQTQNLEDLFNKMR